MKFGAELGKITNKKDDKGNVIGKEFMKEKSLRIDFIIPFGSDLTLKQYGYSITTTHKTITFDKVERNKHLQFKNKVFLIKEVSEYYRKSILLLEEVKL